MGWMFNVCLCMLNVLNGVVVWLIEGEFRLFSVFVS